MKALIPMIAATAALSLSGSVAGADSPPAAHHARPEITKGRVHVLPGGQDLGFDIRGRAMMFRLGGSEGRTVVTLRVRGLEPNTTYPTHVHNQPCSATPPGGSHYQHTVGGPVDAVNEIWPTIETNRRGSGAAFVVHGERARDDAQSIVIHYPPDTSIRLACVDLR